MAKSTHPPAQTKVAMVIEQRGADGEIAHQLLDHDARSDAQHPGIEKECRRRQPAEQRQEA
jgi:hypothetical protein